MCKTRDRNAQTVKELRDSVKNKHDSLFFTRLFVPQASQSSPYRRIKFEI